MPSRNLWNYTPVSWQPSRLSWKILHPSVMPQSFLDTQDGLPHHSCSPVTLRHCCSATSCPSASYIPFRLSRKADSWRLCSTLWPGWEKKHNCW